MYCQNSLGNHANNLIAYSSAIERIMVILQYEIVKVKLLLSVASET